MSSFGETSASQPRPDQLRPEPAMQAFVQRLSGLQDEFRTLADRMEGLGDRFYGSQATAQEKSLMGGDPPVISAASSVSQQIDMLYVLSDRCRIAMNRVQDIA